MATTPSALCALHPFLGKHVKQLSYSWPTHHSIGQSLYLVTAVIEEEGGGDFGFAVIGCAVIVVTNAQQVSSPLDWEVQILVALPCLVLEFFFRSKTDG